MSRLRSRGLCGATQQASDTTRAALARLAEYSVLVGLALTACGLLAGCQRLTESDPDSGRQADAVISDGRADGGAARVPATAAAFASELIELPEIAVIAADGRSARFRSEVAADHLLVIHFNYTTCRAICPVGNVVMQAIDRLADDGLKRPLRLLSITIDPSTDTPARMREASAAAGASERWWWLTGAAADMERLLGRFGARAVDIQTHDPLFLVGDARAGRFVRISGLPEPAQVLRQLAAFDS